MIGSAIDGLVDLGKNKVKAIVVPADNNEIQDNELIGAVSVDMIAANNMSITTGFTFDSVTGLISDYDVMAGEKHVIFYTTQ